MHITFSDAVKVKSETKKEGKEAKLQNKPLLKSSTRKTSNSLSSSKKEKNIVSAVDISPPEPVESQAVALAAEDATSNEEPQLASSCSPAHKHFQRTLSPADVLHVHSYAKGDYGEGEAPPKEEKKVDVADIETEKDNRHVSHLVSKYTSITLCFTVNGFNRLNICITIR